MNAALPPASLSAVLSRIDELADLTGVKRNALLSVDDPLAALPLPFWRRLVLVLQSLKAFSVDPDMQNAAEFFQLKATRVWAAMPFQGHLHEAPAETAAPVVRGAGHYGIAGAKKR